MYFLPSPYNKPYLSERLHAAVPRFHVCGQLHRQKCRRFPPTGDNIQHGLTLYPESKQYGIGRRFEFGRNERSGRGNDSHDGLVSHLPFRSEYPFQLFPVGTPDGFPR